MGHAGIRIEELTELSSPQPHPVPPPPPTGQLVPLLQIAPSKTDTERLLVISPKLADVLKHDHVPDPGPRREGSAGRLLQTPSSASTTRRCRCCSNGDARLENRAMSQNALRDYLDHALAEIGAKDASNRLDALHVSTISAGSSSPTAIIRTACRRTSPRWYSRASRREPPAMRL